MTWKMNKKPRGKDTTPISKKVLFIDFQILTTTQAKVKKHLKPEDTVSLFSKNRLN